MLLKNLWCGKISLRGCVAAAAVSGMLLLAACGGDSGANAPSDKGTSDSEDIQSSSSSQKRSSSSKKTVSSSSSEKAKSSSSSKGKAKSSSSNQSSSSNEDNEIDGDRCWDMPKEAYLNPEIDYGSMTDSRDGQIYRTVKIGNQVWMAENLNYADSIKTPSLLERSWCYNNNAENCAVVGRLYTWTAAIDSVKLATDADNPQNCGNGKRCSLPDTVQGICPDGWHLPTYSEWYTLFTEVGGKSTAGMILMSQTGWKKNGNGTDDVGFSALPAGCRHYGDFFHNEGYFKSDGDYADFWTSTVGFSYSTDGLSYFAYNMGLNYEYGTAGLYNVSMNYGFSVRCLKDGTSSSNQSSSSSGKNGDGWSWDMPKDAYLNPEIDYGSMTDSRDGQIYKTVKIGNQVWMAENLNYADSVTTPSLVGKNWCYGNKVENCDVAGRLYTWTAAIDSVALYDGGNGVVCGYGMACTLPATVQGICPNGWHLPTETEWKTLFTEVGGKSTAGKILRSQTGWYESGDGTDAYGFSALPAGHGNYDNGFFGGGKETYFWSATEHGSYSVECINLDYYGEYAFLNDYYKYNGYSVRCLKD